MTNNHAGMLTCLECGSEIPESANPWMQVTGYERKRDQGGTNHVALRKQTGAAVCVSCMTLLQAGLSTGQLTIAS